MSGTLEVTALAPWERRVFALAHEGEAGRPFAGIPGTLIAPFETGTLQAAYTHCAALTAKHSHSFYLATRLLPVQKRPAMHALYAFCRVSDDMVDRACGNASEELALWRAKTLQDACPGDAALDGDPVALAWQHARLRYGIPLRYARQLLDGVARDLHQNRYQTFEELATYAYGVASTVGLMSMTITGYSGTQAIPYAVKLGVALQMTNILRDVGEDWRAGRVYLPQREMAHFGLCEDDLAEGRVDERWRTFMRFQIRRNRRLYAEALPGVALLKADGRLAITAAAHLYRAILDDIEAHNYDVFNRRAHTGRARKLLELARAWYYTRRLDRVEGNHAAL